MMNRILLLMVLSLSVFGQSPYNRLGYGNIKPAGDPLGSSGGIGIIAAYDSARVSIHNPAALNGLKQVHFGASLGSDFTSSDAGTNNITRLEQLNLAFPVGKNIGLSIGVLALADFAADYEASIEVGSLVENTSGGLWDYNIGLGYALNPKLSLGVKLHMLQGIFRRELSVDAPGISELYVLKGDLTGRSIELGILSRLNDALSVGLTMNLPYRIPKLNGLDSLAGTTVSVAIDEELSAWPTMISLGLVYQQSNNSRILLGMKTEIMSEDSFEDGVLFSLPENWKAVPANTFQLALQHTATDRSSRFIGKRVGWQVGLSAKNHYLASASGELIYEYALISGVSLGLRNGKSIFDISGEFGSHQGVENLPDELFARVKFGIQVSDTWFRKVKRR